MKKIVFQTLKSFLLALSISITGTNLSIAATFTCEVRAIGDDVDLLETDFISIEAPYFQVKRPAAWKAAANSLGYYSRSRSKEDGAFMWLVGAPGISSWEMANDLLSIYGINKLEQPLHEYKNEQLKWNLYSLAGSDKPFCVALSSYRDISYVALFAANNGNDLERLVDSVLGPVLASFKPKHRHTHTNDENTVFLLRHADKDETKEAIPLSTKGHKRARALAALLRDKSIDAIYVTPALRTQQTAAPLAEEKGIELEIISGDTTDKLLKAVKSGIGRTTVVVHHSHSLPSILAELGADRIPYIHTEEYDNIFIIRLKGEEMTSIIRLNYGEPDEYVRRKKNQP